MATAGFRHSQIGRRMGGWGEGKGVVLEDFLLRRMGN